MTKGNGGQLGFAEAFLSPGLGVNATLEKVDGLVKWYRLLRPGRRSGLRLPGKRGSEWRRQANRTCLNGA